jgi:hypothetical protein
MKERFFWKVIAVGVVLGLFAVAYGLCKSSQVPSLSSAAYAADAAPHNVALKFEDVSPIPSGLAAEGRGTHSASLSRAKVVGGWLVIYDVWSDGAKLCSGSITFYPDPQHTWDGGGLK